MIHIFNDLDLLARAAADLFIEAAQESIKERGRFLVALSGGHTPMKFYRMLASEPYRDQTDWTRLHVFWGDERCVPPEDHGSNFGQAREALLNRVPIPEENIHRVKGELDPVSASEDYARVLKEFVEEDFVGPRFDLVLLGMGDDGHTASLFPGSEVDPATPTIAVTAQYQDRPANRVSLTPKVFNRARQIVFLAAGESKAVTLSRVLSDKYIPEELPAQRIHPVDGKVSWFVDEPAASKLPNDLTRRFCEG